MYNWTVANGRSALLMWSLFMIICYCGRTKELNLLTQDKVTVEECQDVTIWCVLNGPQSQVENVGTSHNFDWFNDMNQHLSEDNYKYLVARDNNSYNLTIRKVQVSDAGSYLCESWSKFYPLDSDVELNVIVPKRRATLTQASPEILENIPATFRCNAGFGNDHVEIVWLLDAVPINNQTEQSLVTYSVGGVDCTGRNEIESMLEIRLQRAHTGLTLTCQVLALELLDSANLTIPGIQETFATEFDDLLIPGVPPTSVTILDAITRNPLYNTSWQEILIQVHCNYTFICLVEDTKPAAEIRWSFQGYEVLDASRGLVSTGGGASDVSSTLVLLSVTWPDDDGGRLVCNATGAGGISQTAGVTITVDAPPSNVTLITSSAIVDNTTSVFECTAMRTRTPSYMVWYLDSFNISDTDNAAHTYSRELLETTSMLSLFVQTEQHQGSKLRCEVHHKLLNEPMSKEIVLDVLFCSSPSLTCPTTMESGQTYNLTCTTGSSKPSAELDIHSLTTSTQVQVPYGTTKQTNYAPGMHGGATADLTVELRSDRNDHWKMVVCRRRLNQICQKEQFDECRLNVHFSPLRVTLSEGKEPVLPSMDSPIYRILEVFDKRNYSFTCIAICSNPAALIQWSLEGAVSNVTELQRYGECWNATSRLSLTMRQDTHHAQRITCRVINPLNGDVWKQRSLEFNVIVGIDAPPAYSPTTIITIIACSSALVLAIALCIFVLLYKMSCYKKRSPQSPQREDREMNHLLRQSGDGLIRAWPKPPSSGIELTTFKSFKSFTSQDMPSTSSSVAGGEAYEFPRDKLKLLGVIGSGSFGTVYKAMARGIHEKRVASEVAVKTPNPSCTAAEKEDFLKELELFTVLVQHPNVVSMLGYCRKKDPVYLIMEYVPNGNLEDYLWQEKQQLDQGYVNLHQSIETISSKQILNFAIQIARGMKYLASVQCIHRDLATRNILLDESLVCKVSDFGLARHVPVHQQYEMKSEGRVPFRWMAPESILRSIYTTKSDVWSFGVLLWELVTLGSHPYPGMACSGVLEALLQGLRLPKPAHCSDEIHQLMQDCWQIKPEDRPDFEMLHKRIEAMLANASGYLLMSNFSSDQYVYMGPVKKGVEG